MFVYILKVYPSKYINFFSLKIINYINASDTLKQIIFTYSRLFIYPILLILILDGDA